MAGHRPGVNPNFLVRRRLRLAAPWDPPGLEQALAAFHGFDRLARGPRELTLHYDASRVQLDALLEALAALGLPLAPGRWNRLRIGWYRHTDNNIYLNARDSSSTSCAQSPLRHR